MKRSVSLIILVAGTLLASCSSLQTISFDQLQAADVSFPDAVRKVAVINNMPVLKTKDNHEILSSELEGDGKVASEALAENIANVNYFDQKELVLFPRKWYLAWQLQTKVYHDWECIL